MGNSEAKADQERPIKVDKSMFRNQAFSTGQRQEENMIWKGMLGFLEEDRRVILDLATILMR